MAITKKVSNPLTIIAIFSSIAEVSASVVLPIVGSDMQSIFVWFVMLFPLLIVLLFFVTLNFNYKVLYAPSDFQDDKSFLHLHGGNKIADSSIELPANPGTTGIAF